MLFWRVRNASCVRYEFIRYNDNNFRIIKLKSAQVKNKPVGLSYIWKPEPGDEDYIEHDKYEVDRQVLSRSRKMIRELALCNGFTHFATLTVDSKRADRFSLTECQELLRKKLKALKRKNSDFAYLFITEKHKNGAFHFHGLIKGVSDFYKNDNGYLSHSLFDEIGYNSFSVIQDYTKCCNYILKYITKDCIKNEARNYLYFQQRFEKS